MKLDGRCQPELSQELCQFYLMIDIVWTVLKRYSIDAGV